MPSASEGDSPSREERNGSHGHETASEPAEDVCDVAIDVIAHQTSTVRDEQDDEQQRSGNDTIDDGHED